MDMLLTVQQIQEKSHEEQDLYQVFVDLMKAFCTVNKVMPKSLRHLDCPCHRVNIIQLFYDDMHWWLTFRTQQATKWWQET